MFCCKKNFVNLDAQQHNEEVIKTIIFHPFVGSINYSTKYRRKKIPTMKIGDLFVSRSSYKIRFHNNEAAFLIRILATLQILVHYERAIARKIFAREKIPRLGNRYLEVTSRRFFIKVKL